MSEETISEEQVLHNKLSFEINQELIHLMKRIIETQQKNTQLKSVLKEIREYSKEEQHTVIYDEDGYEFFDKLYEIIDKGIKENE